MNAVPDTNALISKRSSSPRPPADGDEVKKFYDNSRFSESYKSWKMEKASYGDCADTSVKSLDCIDPSSSSPPNPYKWAESLQCLIEDLEGVNLFKKFLKQEGQDIKCFNTLFACRGVKKRDPNDPNDREECYALIKVIFEKNIKRISAISDETKEEIKQKLSSNTGVDNTIFDAAQREIEAYLTKTTYPNFLRSDLYIQHLRKLQNENSPEKERALTPETEEYLPTVHEDAELQISYNKYPPLTKSNLMQRYKFSSSKFKPDGPGGLLQSPYNFHANYNSFLPASTQDSELQSLSSGAQTDDTVSLTDSNVDLSMGSRSKQPKLSQKSSKHAILNKEKFGNDEAFIPRTQRFNLDKIVNGQSPEFTEILCKKLNKVLEDRRREDNMKRNLECVEQEENVQDILDQHISRVFDDGGRNIPVSGYTSPKRPVDAPEKSRIHPRHSSGYSEPSNSYAAIHKHSQSSQCTVPNSIKYRRDHDNQSPDSALYDSVYNEKPVDFSKRSSSKRNAYKKNSLMTDSVSSFVDSGICLNSEPVLSHPKISHRLETKQQEKDHGMRRNSPTSPDRSRPGSSRKSLGHNSSSQDVGGPLWPLPSSHMVSQDLQMPGHAHTDITLNEARKRLEDESRSKIRSRKPNKKSCSLNVIEAATANIVCNDVTVVGYSYGRHSVPYLSKIPGKNITLQRFKTLLSKKGNFRYFFKTASNDFGTGVVFEEVNEDHKVLPLWEGKVFCVIETMDDNCIM